MPRFGLAALATLLAGALAGNHPTMVRLPSPHYSPRPDDPEWLVYAAQFHGHLGPWAVAGFRVAAAARDAAGAQGYFDVEVVVRGPLDRPPRSCFLDGVQVATGATWGKRNVRFEAADSLSVQLTNTKTGRTVIARPAPHLLDVLGEVTRASSPGGPTMDHERLERLARTIAGLPVEQAAVVRSAAP